MQEQYVVLEDPALQHTSTGYNVVVQQLELVSLTWAAVTQNQKADTSVWMLDCLLITMTIDSLQNWKHCVSCIAYQCCSNVALSMGQGHLWGGIMQTILHSSSTLTCLGSHCACSHAQSSLFWLLCEFDLVIVVHTRSTCLWACGAIYAFRTKDASGSGFRVYQFAVMRISW